MTLACVLLETKFCSRFKTTLFYCGFLQENKKLLSRKRKRIICLFKDCFRFGSLLFSTVPNLCQERVLKCLKSGLNRIKMRFKYELRRRLWYFSAYYNVCVYYQMQRMFFGLQTKSRSILV